MNVRMLIVAALAMTPIAVYPQEDAHQQMTPEAMHGTAERGHSPDGEHAQGMGKLGCPKKVSRTIRVLMTDDMKFRPAKIDVKRGETIKFVVKNSGQIKHERVIGSMAELKAHAEMMRKMPGMEHAGPNMVTLDPGKTGELIWQFTKTGTFNFACL